MPLALRVVGRSEYFASGSGKHFWRSLSAVLMDAAPVLATQKRSDRPLEDPGGPCRAWIESDVKGGSYKHFQVSDPIAIGLTACGMYGRVVLVARLGRQGARSSMFDEQDHY